MLKIRYFTDLFAWKVSHELVVALYEILKTFPKEEQFGLTNQMRRAAISITSNIAEGFSRPSYREKIRFYSISLGSVTELQSQLIVARDIKYLPSTKFSSLYKQTIRIHKLINGLIKTSKNSPYS